MYPCTDSGVRKLPHVPMYRYVRFQSGGCVPLRYRCTDLRQEAAYPLGYRCTGTARKLRTPNPWFSAQVPMYRLLDNPTFPAYARGIVIKMRKA
jgi:hypothetical protein